MTLKQSNVVFTIACAIALSIVARAQQVTADGPRYNGTSLIRPSEYREWTFLGTGLGMNYAGKAGSQTAPAPLFTNVFVNPSSFRGFMQTGIWPDKTVFVLELRNSETDTSINGGRFATNLVGLEAQVKDSRFPDGWAFFDFGSAQGLVDMTVPLAGQAVASCVECHTKNAAVERTFVQFYPTLMEVARRMGTVKPGF